MTYREQLCSFLETVSLANELLKYEKEVAIAYVPIEVAEQFFDIFRPKEIKFTDEFNRDELIEVSIFSGYLDIAVNAVIAAESPPISEVLKILKWREMMKKAQALLQRLNSSNT